MRKLVLIRHSAPDLDFARPAREWRLSGEGRRRCRLLAERLADQDLAMIVASEEPKAAETGRLVAEFLGVPFGTAPGLHEHERRTVGPAASQEEFRAQVISALENPGTLVFGEETADEAHRRFAAAIAHVVSRYSEGNLAVVSHGTVMALFIAQAAGLDRVPLWQRLGLPCYATLSLPGYDLLDIVADLGQLPPGRSGAL
jgi:broad specificity phosphatase PhoE